MKYAYVILAMVHVFFFITPAQLPTIETLNLTDSGIVNNTSDSEDDNLKINFNSDEESDSNSLCSVIPIVECTTLTIDPLHKLPRVYTLASLPSKDCVGYGSEDSFYIEALKRNFLLKKQIFFNNIMNDIYPLLHYYDVATIHTCRESIENRLRSYETTLEKGSEFFNRFSTEAENFMLQKIQSISNELNQLKIKLSSIK